MFGKPVKIWNVISKPVKIWNVISSEFLNSILYQFFFSFSCILYVK